MANAWTFVEDNPLVVDLTIDNKVRLDGKGNGNGAGVGDVDNEYTELETVNKRNKEGVGVRETKGMETRFDTEE